MAITYETGFASPYSALSDHAELTFITNSPGGSLYAVAVGFWPGDATEVTAIDVDGETGLFTRTGAVTSTGAVVCELWTYSDPNGLLDGFTGPVTAQLDGSGWIAAVAIQLSGVKKAGYAHEDSDTGTGSSSAPTLTSIAATPNNWAILAAAHNQANSAIAGNNGTRRQEVHGASGGVSILTLGPNSAGSVSPSYMSVAITKKWAAVSAIVPAPASSSAPNLTLLGVG